MFVDNFDLDALKGNARPVAIPFQTMLGGTARWGQLRLSRSIRTASGRARGAAPWCPYGSAATNVELQRFELQVVFSAQLSRSEDEQIGAIDQVTPSLFMISIASRARNSCCRTTRPPRSSGVIRPWLKPVAWFSGAGMNMTSSCVRCRPRPNVVSEKISALWEIRTAFGRPVVPEVERIKTTSSGFAARVFPVGLVRFADLLQRDGAVRFDCLVVNANSIFGKRGNAIDCGKNLVFEVGLVMEGGAHGCLAFHQIHGVDQVLVVK